MNSQPLIDDPRPWAFTRAALAAGLRAYTNDPSLVINDLRLMVKSISAWQSKNHKAPPAPVQLVLA
jgi:hypothetical protein